MSLQVPAFAAVAQDCALCGAGAGRAPVCAACRQALPWLRRACPRCAVPLAAAAPVCGECLRRPPPFAAALAAFEYRFPVDRMVQRYKFRADLALGRWLAEELAARVAQVDPPDVIVVPAIGRRRLRSRGFDQALEIAKVVARSIDVPVDPGAVRRVRDTDPQRGLDALARRANLRGAFACAPRLAGRHIAIVDDVVTTGATVGAVAAALASVGASRVQVWAVARTG